MAIPNMRRDDSDGPDGDQTRGPSRGNPASAYDDGVSGVIEAASSRATTVSHRFGGARYALTRRDHPMDADEPDEPDKRAEQDKREEPDEPETSEEG